MQIYYLFSVKDKYFTDFSQALQNRKPIYSFYGLAYARKPFLNNSIYTNVSYVSDILKRNGEVDFNFLVEIERKYNINVANMIHADRHLLRYSKHKRLFFAQELIKIFINEVTQFKINLVFVEAVDDFISYFAAYFCKYHGIKFFFATYVGYAERACFSSNIDAEPDQFQNHFQNVSYLIEQGKIDLKSVETEIKRYITERKKPSYFTMGDADYKPFQLKDIKTFFSYLVAYFQDKQGMHHDKLPFLVPFYRILRITRKRNYRNFLVKNMIPFDKLKNLTYLIYPLHFEPEASTLIQGRWFNDQKQIIELISKNLPANMLLLVKEHKASIGRRPLSFYKEIVRHHNVFLVDDKIDSYHLIEHSKGVVVISSTMGMEALMLKKPVMSFGERFYNVSKNVYRVENFKMIKEIILSMLNHSFDYQDVVAIFYTLFSLSKDLGCLSHFEYKPADVQRLALEVEQILIS